MAEPEDQMAVAVAGRGRLRASHADREHVIEMLKAAFVQGRVTKDEFEARVGQAFASRTYAELAAVTADIPGGQIAGQPPSQPVRARARPPMSHAAKARGCVVIALVMMTVATSAPGGPALFLFAPLCLTVLMVAAAQILASQHEKRSRGTVFTRGLAAPAACPTEQPSGYPTATQEQVAIPADPQPTRSVRTGRRPPNRAR